MERSGCNSLPLQAVSPLSHELDERFLKWNSILCQIPNDCIFSISTILRPNRKAFRDVARLFFMAANRSAMKNADVLLLVFFDCCNHHAKNRHRYCSNLVTLSRPSSVKIKWFHACKPNDGLFRNPSIKVTTGAGRNISWRPFDTTSISWFAPIPGQSLPKFRLLLSCAVIFLDKK